MPSTLADVYEFYNQPQPDDNDNADTTVNGITSYGTVNGGENFFLSALNFGISTSKLTLHGGSDTDPGATTGDCWARLKVPVSYMRRLFMYQSDAVDVNDQNSQDLKFCVNHHITTTGDITDNAENGNLIFFNSKNIVPTQAVGYWGLIEFYGSRAALNGTIDNTDYNYAEEKLKVRADFTRHIAKELFGIASTDMFINQESVMLDMDINSNNGFSGKIEELKNFRYNYGSGTDNTDSSGNDYVRWNDISLISEPAGETSEEKVIRLDENAKRDLANNFPSKLIFKQMLDNVKSRFKNIDTIEDIEGGTTVTKSLRHMYDMDTGDSIPDMIAAVYDGSGVRVDFSNNITYWRYLPLKINDKIFFTLTCSPAEGQEDVTGVEEPKARTYRIRLDCVADNDSYIESNWKQTGWEQPPTLDTTNITVNP